MTLTRAGALVGIGLLSTGCVTTVAGTPTRIGPLGGAGLPLEQVLPDGAEVGAAVGNALPPHSPPLVGGIDMLPNGIRDNGGAAPVECLGAIAPAMRVVYETGQVRAAATQDYWNYDSGVAVSSATAAAIKLASPADAQRLFASFVTQWQHCAGTTVTVHTHDPSNTELYSKVTNTRVDGPILSATVVAWDNHHTPPCPQERAVGVRADVVADVKVAVGPGAQAGTRAVDVVQAMLRKVSSSN
ncbi:sensor domain-containing protein [Mycobacterium seoulense]|uniref:sensor domain-containing protein n=1 Tax=Mycobacterium seoulense TaxID=386911 RepID=UPI003CF9A2A1